jgi:hypothetical protein
MGCFCHATVAVLASHLPALNAAPVTDAPTDQPGGAAPHAGAETAMALAHWLAARGLPAEPWRPDPAWLERPPPMPRLPASAIATISALAQLRAQVLAQFDLDLLVEAQVRGLARIVATMNARLGPELEARLGGPAAIDPLGWTRLATLNSAIDQVRAALQQGVLTPQPEQTRAMTMPGGVPIGQWGALLRPLRLLAPLIAASLQLDASVNDTARIAAALKALAHISLPPLAVPELMASLSAALAATAALQASLGLAPLQAGLPEVRARVHAKLATLLTALSNRLGHDLTPARQSQGTAPETTPQARMLAQLPKLPVVPSSLATADVVHLAVQAEPLAALNWQVPASLPVVQIGLSTCTLAAQMQAALGVQAVLPAPCRAGCDAARLMGALGSASQGQGFHP